MRNLLKSKPKFCFFDLDEFKSNMSKAEIKKKPLSYIKQLNEEARLKRSQTLLSNENSIREQNFRLFFSGANEERFKSKTNRNDSSRSPCVRKIQPINAGILRKRWETPSTPALLRENNLNIQTLKISPRALNLKTEKAEFDLNIFIERVKKLSEDGKREMMKKLEELEG
jgi:hypothetical protein